MLGRVLFAFVWLIIAAGVALPLYPGEAVISVVTAASDPMQPVAASGAFGCEDCPVPDADVDCRSDQVLPAVFVPLQEELDMTFAASERLPAKLPAKLPAI